MVPHVVLSLIGSRGIPQQRSRFSSRLTDSRALKVTAFAATQIICGMAGWWAHAFSQGPLDHSGWFVASSHSPGYTVEEFAAVNRDMEEILTEVAGPEAAQNHLVFVIPGSSGHYTVSLIQSPAGPKLSSVQEDQLNKRIADHLSTHPPNTTPGNLSSP